MDTIGLTLATESLPVPLDRLFRMPEEVYRQMVAHGFFRAEEVALVDGLLVKDDHFYRMTLDQYDRAVDGSILGPDDSVVLLDGLLVAKMGRHPPHVTVTQKTWQALVRVLPDGWYVRKEDPLAIPEGPTGHDSEPEPDLAVVRGDVDDYEERHPRPENMALVVEVADSSLREDRQALARYAWAGIPVVWIIDVRGRDVEVYSNPTRSSTVAAYQAAVIYREGDEVPVVVDGRQIALLTVSALLTRPARS